MAEIPTGRERLKPLAAAKIPFTDHVALMRLSTSGLGAETIKQYSVRYRTALAVILDLDPSLADAEVEELGVGLRPALPDNLPTARLEDGVVRINGLYRHGFLLAPALAELTFNYVMHGARDNEIMRWS